MFSQAGNRLERLGLVCLGQDKFAEARIRLSRLEFGYRGQDYVDETKFRLMWPGLGC